MRISFAGRLAGLLAVLLSVTPAVSAESESAGGRTTSPVKHLVVIFQENVSFDHYFGTYPNATNPPGEPRFVARDDTPIINGLTPDLLTANPNLGNPNRLDRSEALTCDQNHVWGCRSPPADQAARSYT